MHTQSLTRSSGNPEVVRTYTITEHLSVRLTEIPCRLQFPTCACCGDGNYWHVTWPTGVLLARYLAAPARQRVVAGKQVLVIGCTGLEAVVLAKLGAVVSVLDHIPAALELVQQNCMRNQLASLTTHTCCWRDVRALRRLPPYEMVIGSDVLYDVTAARGVHRLLRHVLPTRGTAFIADPLRADTRGVDTFLALMTGAGFARTARWMHSAVYGTQRRIRVYRFTPQRWLEGENACDHRAGK